MKVSIIIPAHNEASTVDRVIRSVLEVAMPGWERELIIVDDGSTDGTGKILEIWKKQKDTILNGRFKWCPVIIVEHEENMGKGAAIRTGLSRAAGDFVLIQDADLEYNPNDIPKLLSGIDHSESAIAVYGARGVKRYPERGLHYVFGAWVLTWLVNVLYGSGLTDVYTGYKIFPTQVLKSLDLQSEGFEFEAEVSCRLLQRGIKILEIPISYTPRNKDQGKHIGWFDAVKGFWTIIRLKFHGQKEI